MLQPCELRRRRSCCGSNFGGCVLLERRCERRWQTDAAVPWGLAGCPLARVLAPREGE